MKSGQLQVARVGRERGSGALQGHGCPACLCSSPFRNVKRRQDGDRGRTGNGLGRLGGGVKLRRKSAGTGLRDVGRGGGG